MGSSVRPSYSGRLFLGLLLYSVVLVGSFTVFQYSREKEFKVEELNTRLQGINADILDLVEDSDSVEGSVAAQTEYKRRRLTALSHRFGNLRISVIDLGGKVVFDNSLDSLPGSNHLDRREIADALRNGTGYTIRRHSESTGETYFYSARAGEHHIVRTAVAHSLSLSRVLAADYGFIWTILAITAVMLAIGYIATRRLGENIARLNRFAKQAERGEKIYDDQPFPHDELGEISSHIVRLYARLQQAVADRDREHRAALREEQEKIRIKRTLTNNINHELKTPVASMQVCLETLADHHRDMSPEKRGEFIDRCYSANMRLQRLMADVAAITRLEDGSATISAENLDPAQIVADVCGEFEVEAAGRGVEIVCTVAPGFLLTGNASFLASIFRNLIANALAYSGGTRIEITRLSDGSDGSGMQQFRVSDNGCGVPEEHLAHIFERFYRVDKGRSRQLGGTGLGLSIVRNAVVWHGGTISAANLPAGGLAFTFTLACTPPSLSATAPRS